GRVSLRERRRSRVTREERRRHHVDPNIRGLRRENRGDEQLERVAVVQLRVGIRMLLGERVDDPAGVSGGLQCTGPFDQPTFEYDSENTRMCSCSAATRFGTNCTGTTTRARTGARTTCSLCALRTSSSESGITSQKVSVKSKGVW